LLVATAGAASAATDETIRAPTATKAAIESFLVKFIVISSDALASLPVDTIKHLGV
jgi:TRAP-type uncharacterized transport system fused permease subunit